MYIVKYGNEYLHYPLLPGYVLVDLSCQAEENNSGYCDFTIEPKHPSYSKLKERDISNPITVYDGSETDDNLLFYGYIYELGTDFQLSGTVKCRGSLDFLSSSRVRPYSTLSGFRQQAPSSIDLYFEWLIAQHNSQVESEKQFVVGINQGALLDSNNYIFRESSNYPTTYDEIQDKIINELGGYLRVRIQNGTKYIDLLSEWTDTNTQIIDFGSNLLDLTITVDGESVSTYVIPMGAAMKDTEYDYNNGYSETTDVEMDLSKDYYTYDLEYVQCDKLLEFEPGVQYYEVASKKKNTYVETKDIVPVRGKKYYTSEWKYNKVPDDVEAFAKDVTYYEYFEEYDESDKPLTIDIYPDYEYVTGYKKQNDLIYCDEAVQKYGWIGTTYEDSEITTIEGLMQAAIVYLRGMIHPVKTIESRAIDLHIKNPKLKPIKVGEYVRTRSYPHKEDGYFLCTSIDLDLNNPGNSTYTFGVPISTLTGMETDRIKELNATINSDFEAASAIGNDAKVRAVNATSLAISGAKTATDFISVGSNDSEIIIGDQTAEELGNNVFIDNESVQIRDNEVALAKFARAGLYFYAFKNATELGLLVRFGLRQISQTDFITMISTDDHLQLYSAKDLYLYGVNLIANVNALQLQLRRFKGDLNSVKYTTILYCDIPAMVTNKPVEKSGYAICVALGSSGYYQTYRTVDNESYYRTNSSASDDSWSEWAKEYTADEIRGLIDRIESLESNPLAAPIVIITQPVSIICSLGDTVNFKVHAIGSGLTYQWQYSYTGTSWTSDSNGKTDTYSFRATASDDGLYARCVIRNAKNQTVVSDVVRLTIQ